MKNNIRLQELKKRLEQTLKGVYLIIHNFPNRRERRNKLPRSKIETNQSFVNIKRKQIKEDRKVKKDLRKQVKKNRINNEKETI